MGRKVHPIGFRLGIIKDWQSRWYADRNYTDLVQEDARIRKMVTARLTGASLSRIEIQRSASQIEVSLHTAKPGVVIGKGGQAVDLLRKDLETMTSKKVKLNIEEIKQPELDAYLVAESISEQINRRVSYKRAMKQAVMRTMRSGAKGIKIRVSGRLGGAEMARSAWEREGRVPLHTIRADIDYGQVHAATTYGRIGVKVWIYRGDVIERKGDTLLELDRPVAMAQPRPERNDRNDRGGRSDRGDRGGNRGPRPDGARNEGQRYDGPPRGPRPERTAGAPAQAAPGAQAQPAPSPVQPPAPAADAVVSGTAQAEASRTIVPPPSTPRDPSDQVGEAQGGGGVE